MSTINEIRHRIQSVRDTRKITNAMYLIASTKVRKARADLERTRPYFTALKTEIDRMFAVTDEDTQSLYFGDGHEDDGTRGLFVITADKGLAGAYNQNVLKKAQELYNEHRDAKLYVVGEYGRQFFVHHGITVEPGFDYTAQDPTLHRAREICELMIELYKTRKLSRVDLIYTDFRGGVEVVSTAKLLPLDREKFIKKHEGENLSYEYEQPVAEILARAMHSFVAGFVYSALVDSYCSEQNARMIAMSGADKNAEEILSDLSLEFNRLRQAAITQEITEISSGAKSMRNNGAKS